jgi:CheY-like chemotaxis protein
LTYVNAGLRRPCDGPQDLQRRLSVACPCGGGFPQLTSSMTETSARRCLIAEDQALIGLSLEAYLADAGYEPIGPFATNDEALRSIGETVPDLALLDVLLRDGPCTPLVRELRRRGVPFAIYSGVKPHALPPELEGVPWLEKPAAREELIRALDGLEPNGVVRKDGETGACA